MIQVHEYRGAVRSRGCAVAYATGYARGWIVDVCHGGVIVAEVHGATLEIGTANAVGVAAAWGYEGVHVCQVVWRADA
jgi:hypothetical protein